LKVKELIKLIEADGWVQIRILGSHRQYKIQQSWVLWRSLETQMWIFHQEHWVVR